MELANWLLPGSEDYIQEQKRSGSTKDISVKDRVAVSLAYYNAWPDAEGVIVIYDDIYNLDMKSC